MTAPPGREQEPSTKRTWLVRLAIAIVGGIAIGAGVGVATVNKFDPGRADQADSLQLMLDSLARAPKDRRSMRRAADSTDAAERAQRTDDSTSIANDPEAAVVPSVVNIEEGAARDSIEAAGLTVGNVSFQHSKAPLGVVIATIPAAGQKARARSAVNIILSDGRPPADTTAPNPAPELSPRS